jgi:hypothetical protein
MARDPAVPDVLAAAWAAAGRPDPGVPLASAGACIRCARQVDAGAELEAVVSGNYGDWDRLPGRHATGPLVWCAPCAWGHRHPPLRTRPHHVTATRCQALGPPALFAVLAAPLPADQVVLVPISRHKHLAPFAAWGTVATDDLTLAWTEQDAWCLAVLGWLRGLGFGEAALRRPTPPLSPGQFPPAVAGRIVTRWADLDPWRRQPPWLEVGLRATRRGGA